MVDSCYKQLLVRTWQSFVIPVCVRGCVPTHSLLFYRVSYDWHWPALKRSRFVFASHRDLAWCFLESLTVLQKRLLHEKSALVMFLEANHYLPL